MKSKNQNQIKGFLKKKNIECSYVGILKDQTYFRIECTITYDLLSSLSTYFDTTNISVDTMKLEGCPTCGDYSMEHTITIRPEI
jgi:hypothetical protein